MKYIVTVCIEQYHVIQVEADSPQEAREEIAQGEIISIELKE